jgi:sulfatase modifying factor 1
MGLSPGSVLTLQVPGSCRQQYTPLQLRFYFPTHVLLSGRHSIRLNRASESLGTAIGLLLEVQVMRTSNRVVAALALFVILPASVPGAMQSTCPPFQKDSPAEHEALTDSRTAQKEDTPCPARRVISNSINMELVYIGPGEFFMGAMSREAIAAAYGGGQGDYAQEEPMHWVQISDGFWMGRTEVTRGQFRRFVGETGYKTTAEVRGYGGGLTKDGWGWVKGLNWRSAGIDQRDDHPVVQVSWFDATEFCKWLSRKEQRRYALPTEAQWEYACRAGSETAFCWGDAVQGGQDYGNMADESTQRWIRSYRDITIDTSPWDDGYATPAPVASFKPNAWGLYDMHGNACEWCRDWYGYDYYAQRDGFDPTGPTAGVHRVLRGGSWVRHPRECRSGSRHSILPTFRSVGRGFRVVILASASN